MGTNAVGAIGRLAMVTVAGADVASALDGRIFHACAACAHTATGLRTQSHNHDIPTPILRKALFP